MSELRLSPTPSPTPVKSVLETVQAPAVGSPAVAPRDHHAAGEFPPGQLAALQTQGLLPLDFGRASAWDQKSMWRGAQRIQSSAWIEQTRQSLKVGDIVIAHGFDPFITPMDGGARYIHSAIVTRTDPPTVVEAWGPNDSGKASVREVPFAEFVDGTRADGYKVVRPSTDPAIAQHAVAYAQKQVGKPYDWSFGLFGASAGAAWYCSDLVNAAYHEAAGPAANPLAFRKDPQRDRLLAAIHDVASALRLQDPSKMTQLIAMAYNSPLLVKPEHAKYSVDDLLAFTRDQILAQDPVFKPLMHSKAGQQLVLDASAEVVKQFVKAGALDPKAVRTAFLGRFHRLGWRDKLSVGFALLRGAAHVRFRELWQAKKAVQHGALAGGMVSPQDIAEGANARSWTFGIS